MPEGNWVSAWLGRGPLSTTITTDRTFQDPVPDLGGRTLRIVAHLTAEGVRVRVRLSQKYSRKELEIDEARIGLPGGSSRLTFGGKPTVLVPAGGELWSDPVDFLAPAGDVWLSFFVPGPFVPDTEGGRGLTKTSYHAPGNQTAARELIDPEPIQQVFIAYEIQVLSPVPAATIVALGDSITEGACSTLDANASWPELLARRLALPGRRTAVVNAGIGSGRWVSADAAGERGLTRLVSLLALPNLTWVIVHMGVNDISYEGADAKLLIEAFSQAIVAAHQAGVALAVIPILPFGGSAKDFAANVQVAQEVNEWIRAHGRREAGQLGFDAVLDVEEALRAPGWALRPDLTDDGVHPNQAGYQVFADAIPLEAFGPLEPEANRSMMTS